MSIANKVLSIKPNCPLIMGILNVTPDSFSDGGKFNTLDSVKNQLELFQLAKVDITDIGGESTRPGASVVSLQQELDRVIPVIELAVNEFELAVSIDTYKTPVMAEAVKMGVGMINDVNALQEPGAKELVASSGVLACLMHKQGEFSTMQNSPSYLNVVDEVVGFLNKRLLECEQVGIKKSQLIVDPGFGFGKNLAHNVELFNGLDKLKSLNCPILVGVSRKKMITELLKEVAVTTSISERMVGSVTAAMLAIKKGVSIVRVHDVVETRQALKIMQELGW
ncbi:MAG TPA: dihydropteroate synthase [Thiomicrospira sp.]|jgi:dihydropteroate synthase|nr:dihydropteroate synthase [Thiomicrospira sp.]